MCGAWERLVRTVKSCLHAAMPTRVPKDELLLTMLAEVENIINNRPLTYVSIDTEDDEALTPNHFIYGSSSGSKPVGDSSDTSENHRNNWANSQAFANRFWIRWTKEYLPSLRRRTKWHDPNVEEVAIGDIVILIGEEKGTWPKGKVIQVHQGRDGHVRSVDIQLATGIYTRPVSKLAVLDVLDRCTLETSTRIPGGNVTSSTKISTTPCTPTTSAATSDNVAVAPTTFAQE